MQKILPTPFTIIFTIKLFSLIILPFGFSFLIPENMGLGVKIVIYLSLVFVLGFSVKNYIILLIKDKFLK